MAERTALVLEPQKASLGRLTKLVEELGFTALGTDSADEALKLASRRPDLILVSDLALREKSGDPELCQSLRAVNDTPAPLVVITSQKEARNGANRFGADALLGRPLRREVVAATVKALGRVRELGEEVERLRAEVASRDERLRRVDHVEPFDPKTNFYHFEFFKRLLVVELRRSKRYGFPLALLLVAIDPLPELARTYSPALARDISDGVALAISRSIRDIDIPVHYADSNILVMLPHTDGKGAAEVGSRIGDRIRRAVYKDEQLNIHARLTASIGVSAFEPQSKQVSFAQLIRDASLALRAAQAKGGNQVVRR